MINAIYHKGEAAALTPERIDRGAAILVCCCWSSRPLLSWWNISLRPASHWYVHSQYEWVHRIYCQPRENNPIFESPFAEHSVTVSQTMKSRISSSSHFWKRATMESLFPFKSMKDTCWRSWPLVELVNKILGDDTWCGKKNRSKTYRPFYSHVLMLE